MDEQAIDEMYKARKYALRCVIGGVLFTFAGLGGMTYFLYLGV
jgi:hypothetical protein